MTIAEKTELRRLVLETVRQEIMRVNASVVRTVPAAEQREIEKRYGKPSRRAVRTTRVRI